MKASLAQRLQCPACGGSDLTVKSDREEFDEIREGSISCAGCRRSYPIRKGIAELVGPELAAKADETEGWVDFARREGWNQLEPAYLDALPFQKAKELMPKDTLTWDRHGRNFFRTLSHLDLAGKRVLDLGAGRCWSTKYLALQGADCVASDLMSADHVGLGAAEHYLRTSPIFFERVRADMNQLPFQAGAFDIVFAQGAIHHSLDMSRTLNEIARVLTRGGLLVLTNEHCNDWRGQEAIEVKEMPGVHEHCYRGYRLFRWLRQSGFRGCRVIPDVYFWKRGDYYYSRWAELARLSSRFIGLKLLLRGGVFNLITVKQ